MVSPNLNNEVYATLRPSKIHGIGVFAIRNIPKGTKITTVYTQNLMEAYPIAMDVKKFKKLRPEIRNIILDRTMQENSNILLFNHPNADACLRNWMNHSDDNNSDGVVALRDIKKDEEITEDYRVNMKHAHPVTEKHYSWLN